MTMGVHDGDEELAVMLNSIGEGVIATDAKGTITRMNPVAQELTGWSLADAKGRPSSEVFVLVDEASGAAIEDPVTRALRDGRVVGLAAPSVLRSRTLGDVSIAESTSPIRGSAGTLLGVVLVFRDQTVERRAARSLEQSAARLRILVETSRMFSTTIGVTQLLDVIARRVSAVIGDLCAIRLVSADGEWLEATHAIYHPNPEMLTIGREVVRQRIGAGGSGRVVTSKTSLFVPHIETKDLIAHSDPDHHRLIAAIGACSILVVPMMSKGRVLGVMNLARSDPKNPYTEADHQLARDLADRAALAIENALLVDELEERIAHRTAALEAANREIEAFSYTVAHDLRAPLRAMAGFSAILMEEHEAKLDDGGRSLLRRVVANADRMGRLIDALLSLANLSRTPLHHESFDLAVHACGIVDQLKTADPARVVEIVIPERASVHGDPRLLGIAIENLLRNAWKFTRETTAARVEVAFEETDDGCAITIRDNGAGFDMAYAGKLFTPFQRLHSADRFEGTGIGLATVERIVRRHGGTIAAQGTVGAGAAFTLTLPRRS